MDAQQVTIRVASLFDAHPRPLTDTLPVSVRLPFPVELPVTAVVLTAVVRGMVSLRLLPGEYAGVIDPANSGSEGAPVTYRASEPLMAVIKGGAIEGARPGCVRIVDREYIAIDGLYLLPVKGGWMHLERANHCVVRNCRMENAIGHGSPVQCNDCHYNRY